jgi:hypothetical protein
LGTIFIRAEKLIEVIRNNSGALHSLEKQYEEKSTKDTDFKKMRQ